MKLLSRLTSVAVVAYGATLFQLASHVEAATFDFRTGTAGNQSTKTFLDSGITLLVSDSNSTGNNPLTLETIASLGLCAYAVSTTAQPRCGYGNTIGDGISRFKLTFDKAVLIDSFVVLAFNQSLMNHGTLSFC